MNGKLPAVAKAMILASLPLCALVSGCGGGSDDPRQVSADELLGDIYPHVDESLNRIVDTSPPEEALISLEEVSRSLNEEGARVERGALIRMRPAPTGVQRTFVPPEQWPEVLTWALEMDLSSYTGDGIFDDEATTTILFVNADDGTFVSLYER